MTVIKNIECFAPKHLGIKDICIINEKIYQITAPGKCPPCDDVIDGTGLMAFPGIIDGHVHITGGGGEEGFKSRIGQIDINDIFEGGVTTAVGLLGADDQTKSLFDLLAKAKSLEAQGMTTFIYSGSYSMPVVTFTGDIVKDMILIDKVIGAGEIAISDHRSSHPDIKDLLALASKIHLGGLLADKPGLLHLHLGDGKGGLSLLTRLLSESDLPVEVFLPTHVNRNPELLNQAADYAKSGGNIDLTSGEETGVSLPNAVSELLAAGVNPKCLTASSDANGSIPCGGVGKIQTLLGDIVSCITKNGISPETAFSLVTENPAKRIHQHPKKGAISEGSDADILILNKNYELQALFAMGQLKIDNRKRNQNG